MSDSSFRSISLKCHVRSTASVRPRRARNDVQVACTHDLQGHFLDVDEADAPVVLTIVRDGVAPVDLRSCDDRLWMRTHGHVGRTVGVEITAKNIGEIATGALQVTGMQSSPISTTAHPFEPAIGDVVISDGYAAAQQALHDFCADVRLIGNQLHVAMPVPMLRLAFVPSGSEKVSARVLSTIEASRLRGDRPYSLFYAIGEAEAFSDALALHSDRHGCEIDTSARLLLRNRSDLLPSALPPSVDEQIFGILRSFGSTGGLIMDLSDEGFEHWVSVRRAMDAFDALGAVQAFAGLCHVDMPNRWFRAAAHAALLVETAVATQDCCVELKARQSDLDLFSWRSS